MVSAPVPLPLIFQSQCQGMGCCEVSVLNILQSHSLTLAAGHALHADASTTLAFEVAFVASAAHSLCSGLHAPVTWARSA